MPFGKWDSFEACVADIMKQNPSYDEETAKATCGKLKAALEGKIPWQGSVKIEGKKVKGQALHPIKTYHPGEWPELRVYLEEELKKSVETLTGKPFGVDHLRLLPEPNRITRAWWENDAINYEGEVDDETAQMIGSNGLPVSVEYDWDIMQKMNGVAPKGLEFTSLHFLRNFEPGDPKAYAELAEAVFNKLKEAKKAKEQARAEPQDFILYRVRDLALFMPEHFQVIWVNQNLGIQALYGRLIEKPESIQPFALLFMKGSGWDNAKIDSWLNDHPQYSRQSLAPQPVGVQASPPSPKVGEGIEKMNEQELNKLVEGQVQTALEAALEKKLKEAEWDTEYINNLPDSAFAVIGSGGKKDEQGKTVPRTLRKLPHHNAAGDLDIAHLQNALARLNQVEDANKAEAKKHLCAHAKDSEIVSEFCGEEPPAAEGKSAACSTPPKSGLGEALVNPSDSQPNEFISRKIVIEAFRKEGIPQPKQIVFSHGQTGGFKRLHESVLRVLRKIEKGEI